MNFERSLADSRSRTESPMNGKGSKPRPLCISYQEFSDNWENIFGRKDTSVPFDQQHTDTQTPQKKKKTKNG